MFEVSSHRIALATFLATALLFVMYQVGGFDTISEQKGTVGNLTYCRDFGYVSIPSTPPGCECLMPGNSSLCRIGYQPDEDHNYCCPVLYCSDRTVTAELGETCDDGNLSDGDGCDANCKSEICGNALTQTQIGEQCDDGNTVDEDGCSALCKVEVCGNNSIESYRGENCDDGNLSDGDGCDSYCQSEVCGNNIQQVGEECDDGNTANNDGCNSSCKWERCGDGTVHTGEECDDGNTTNNDGCSSICKNEFCGDTTTQTNEKCDDGNTVNGDGCDANCKLEVCGNGILQFGEVCDDGNANYYDGCNTECQNDYCGDGNIDAGEDCDDGNGNNYDSCNTACQNKFCGNSSIDEELGEQCDDGNGADNDSCDGCKNNLCGNGTRQGRDAIDLNGNGSIDLHWPPGCDAPFMSEICLNPALLEFAYGEGCDDGNRLNNDGCNRDCFKELCGNDTPDPGEGCDDGNLVDGDGCDKYCRNEVCGNGFLQGTPEKDTDGDGVIDVTATGAGEGCEVTAPGLLYNPTNVCGPYWPECDPVTCHCYNNGCGDGIIQRRETCDDGNRVSFDGCSAGCRLEICGNGVREGAGSGTLVTWWDPTGPRYTADVGEKCDDGNTIDYDGCSSTCIIDRCGDGVRQGVDGIDADGNGIYEVPARGEACDDGNTIDDDGCRQNCTVGCEDDFDCPDLGICQPGRCAHGVGSCPPFMSCISGICFAHTTYTGDPLSDPGSCNLTCKDGQLVDKLAIITLALAGGTTGTTGGADLLYTANLTAAVGASGGSSSSKGRNAALCEVEFSYPCDPGGADCGHAKVHTQWGPTCCNGAGSQNFDFPLNPLPPLGGVIVAPPPTKDGLTVSMVGVCNGGAAGKKFIPACTCGSSSSSSDSSSSSRDNSSSDSSFSVPSSHSISISPSSNSSFPPSTPSSASLSLSTSSSVESSSMSMSLSPPSSSMSLSGSNSSGESSSESSSSSDDSASSESSSMSLMPPSSSENSSSSSTVWFCNTTIWQCTQQ